MTIEQAIEELRNENEQCLDECEGCCSQIKNDICTCRDAVILSTLEQYKKIGTIEKCKKAMSLLGIK